MRSAWFFFNFLAYVLLIIQCTVRTIDVSGALLSPDCLICSFITQSKNRQALGVFQNFLCTIQSHGTKSHMLVSKLRCGTSKTVQLVPVHLDLPLFWKSHYATCSPACVIFVPCDRIVQRAYLDNFVYNCELIY